MNRRTYEQTKYKERRRKKYERECANKNLHGKDGSRHQRNKKLAEARQSEVIRNDGD